MWCNLFNSRCCASRQSQQNSLTRFFAKMKALFVLMCHTSVYLTCHPQPLYKASALFCWELIGRPFFLQLIDCFPHLLFLGIGTPKLDKIPQFLFRYWLFFNDNRCSYFYERNNPTFLSFLKGPLLLFTFTCSFLYTRPTRMNFIQKKCAKQKRKITLSRKIILYSFSHAVL